MSSQVVSLLHHQHQDHHPDDGADPGPRHGALDPQVVGEGDVVKVAHIRHLVRVVLESIPLIVILILSVVLLQLKMIDLNY